MKSVGGYGFYFESGLMNLMELNMRSASGRGSEAFENRYTPMPIWPRSRMMFTPETYLYFPLSSKNQTDAGFPSMVLFTSKKLTYRFSKVGRQAETLRSTSKKSSSFSKT